MKEKKKISTLNLLTIIQLVVMVFVTLGITKVISSATRENAVEHMKTLTDERAQIILNYVQNAEKTLTYFGKAQQVKDILNQNQSLSENVNILTDSGSKEIVDKAQAYTEDYSDDIENLEGLWIGDWKTHCIAHTNKSVVGMVTRKDPEPLQQLQASLVAAGPKGVYNAGMIISPATNKQIVSMYKPIYNNDGEPMGFVGLGIFTKELITDLDKLKIKGMDSSTYSMVNVKDGKYVFHNDQSMIGEIALNKKIGKICEEIKSDTENKTFEGSFTYTADNGVKYISAYTYIPEYGWLLMLDDPKSEAYSLAQIMRVYTVVFGIIVIALILIFYFVNKRQEKMNQKLASTIAKSNKTKDSLYTAMFKDVLTDVSNRIAFSMDVEETNTPHFFAIFNISDFSNINTSYGNDTGDWLLVRTVDILKQVFKKGKIYRTGSDEFVVSVEVGENMETENMIEDVKDAYRRLTALQNTPVGKLNFGYRSAIAKKSNGINTSVIAVLKDMINKNAASGLNDISFNDLDMNS
jgi:GGDEF domain-containing protein